jgi:nucleotide-binding universal stress UspA family protein
MFTKVLVGVDGSDASKQAFHVALDLAKTHHGELHVASVIEDLPQYAEMLMDEVDERRETEVKELQAMQDDLSKSEGLRARRRHARRHFQVVHEPLARTASGAGVTVVEHIHSGHPVEVLVRLATQLKADCIVLGALGHSHFLRRLSGGTGTQIAYHAPCSVLIVRPPHAG